MIYGPLSLCLCGLWGPYSPYLQLHHRVQADRELGNDGQTLGPRREGGWFHFRSRGLLGVVSVVLAGHHVEIQVLGPGF